MYPIQLLALLYLSYPLYVLASITVHRQDSQIPIPTATASYTGYQAYNPVTLSAPPLPTPAPPKSFSIEIDNNPNPSLNLSIPQSGAFMGFSIEFSAASQISKCAFNHIIVYFMNYFFV
jgi:hypothetical protein